MRFLSWLFSIPVIIIVLVFALQNRNVVELSFWPFDAKLAIPVSLLVLVMFVMGLGLGAVKPSLALFGARCRIRRMDKEIAKLREQAQPDEEDPEPHACDPMIMKQGRYQVVRDLEAPTHPTTNLNWFKRRNKP